MHELNGTERMEMAAFTSKTRPRASPQHWASYIFCPDCPLPSFYDVPGPGAHEVHHLHTVDANVGAMARSRREERQLLHSPATAHAREKRALLRTRGSRWTHEDGDGDGANKGASPRENSLEAAARLRARAMSPLPGPGEYEIKQMASGREWSMRDLNGAERMPMAAFTSRSPARSSPLHWSAGNAIKL